MEQLQGMKKFILEYADLSDDGKRILQVLAENGIEVVDSTSDRDLYQHIVIRIRDINELNWIMDKLNQVCEYGVKVIKKEELG
jgi:hypothetical protein